MRNGLVLDVKRLKTYFFLKEGTVRAVDGADFRLLEGEVLGVVGESGCGKSITAQSILRIIQPPGRIVEGTIEYFPDSDSPVDLVELPANGEEMRRIRGEEISIIFQEPMTAFSPVHTIGSQVSEGIRIHQQLTEDQARDKAIDIFKIVGIPRQGQVYKDYPHQLSGGMRQRAMIAMALIGNPKILIADEPTTAIDVTLQAQVLRLLNRLQQQFNLSVMFITHDLGVIAQLATKVAVMYLGKIVEYGTVEQIYDDPKHPYTRDLMRSVPKLGKKDHVDLATIKGSVPDPYSIPSGCPFHPRCGHAMRGICDGNEYPESVAVEEGHRVSCFLFSKNQEVDHADR